MTNTTPMLSVFTLDQLSALCPPLKLFIDRQLANTYEDFTDILYNDIDIVISKLQENPELRQKDGEDRLTIDIINMLNTMGYNATHDEKYGGHTDILVRKHLFVWIGEAKKHSNYDYLWEGFLQLSTRYSTGEDKQKQGGVIIYIFNKDAKAVMDQWKDYLAEKKLENYKESSCTKRGLAFISTHKHTKSGLPFKVRHMPVLLHHDPQDKSGRNRKIAK